VVDKLGGWLDRGGHVVAKYRDGRVQKPGDLCARPEIADCEKGGVKGRGEGG
jgi:hypothetical protein